MALLDSLIELSIANRLVELEFRSSDVTIRGDFTGSVTGYWQKLGDNGEGLVEYNSKIYTTSPIGFTSIPKGSEVELSHGNGIYYSKF